MARAYVTPDAVCYNSLMNGCAKRSDAFGAEAWYVQMVRTGVTPTDTAYNIMVNVHGKAGRLHEATEWFNKMKAARKRPSVITWTSLIEACASSEPKRAVEA